MIDPDAYVARARQIAARELDGGVVVVTLAKQNIHFLNESAVELWPLMFPPPIHWITISRIIILLHEPPAPPVSSTGPTRGHG